MSSFRSPAWLAALHLERAEGGEQALGVLERLSKTERGDVLAFGERIAAHGQTLAQAYSLRAPEARAALGAEAFAAWAARVVALGGAGLVSRETVAAFFALEPRAVALAGAAADRWIELAAEVQRVSRRLSAEFLEGTASLLRGSGARALPQIEVWARAGVELATGAGWRGEFLAAAFFEAGPQVLPALEEHEVALWATLGRSVQTGRDLDQDFFRRLPSGFADLAPGERRPLFDLALGVARGAPRTARELFARIPAVVAALGHAEREPLLAALAAAAPRDPDECLKLLPLAGAIVRSIPAAERAPVLARVARAAARFPRVLAPLLRSLPRAREETDIEGIARWIDHGERLAAENEGAGRAFFALESRSGLVSLRESSPTARIDEVEGVLRSLARMLSARSLQIRGAGGASLRAFFDLESLDRSSVAVPATVSLFDSWEDNFLLLKLVTVNAVGRLLYGTYDLSLPRAWERLPRELAEPLAAHVVGDGLRGLLESLPEADPLIGVFAACEGARLDTRLSAAFRGYAAELRRLALRLEEHAVASGRHAGADVLLFLLGAGASVERLLRLAPREVSGDLLALVADTLRSPVATVEDALAAAILLRERFAESVAISGFGPQTTYEELFFERLTGEAPLDMEAEEAALDAAGAQATEIVDVDPAAVEETDEEVGGTPLSAEELRRLLEAGAILKVGAGRAADSAGVFLSGSWLPKRSAPPEDVRGQAAADAAAAALRGRAAVLEFEYDEWDYEIGDYRSRWCRLKEMVLAGDSGEFFQQALARHADLLPDVRRQFQRIRPERYQRIRGLEDGEDFDLNAVVNARAELAARRSPSPRFYVARRREERDVATLFLLDMSASTDEPLVPPERGPGREEEDGWVATPRPPSHPRRIIDVTKEALVIMAEALDEIGDQYAIYGFSGEGRLGVEFYRVKHFNEGLTSSVRSRIGGIEPRRSTRMGAALRHARAKMANLPSRSKHILLLSDGFPQDFDYGTDRRSNVYGIRDTMKAFQECQAAGITAFCITVDKTGHDYLRQICETSRYMVIDEVEALPAELPKIYERWVQG
ncbi:MAG: nitric oxide reductase NorD protein [Candidatus Binatota bacterium]|nr:nitric oxide reductase NorD protein [Candidatus Binatota bacterium]